MRNGAAAQPSNYNNRESSTSSHTLGVIKRAINPVQMLLEGSKQITATATSAPQNNVYPISRLVKNTGPLKPARTYAKSLNRSKSFSVHAMNGCNDPSPIYMENNEQQLHK
ncbi:hypothetical protein CVS40_2252 [Lucilia cuprina]|nr:hypothetical protein CVS40_2252 [Lucilia cuprina]